jgi:glycosyltransferase involved in cell wall biosynthesis
MRTVAYLANQFPVAVEPYVGEEIEELRRRGARVIAGSVRRTKTQTQMDGGGSCEEDVICLQPIRWWLLPRAAWLGVRGWRRIAGLLRRVMFEGRESPLRRLKAVAHTGLGAYYAVLLKEHEVDHIHAHHGYFGSWVAMVAARLLGVGFSMTLHGSDLLLHGTYLDIKLEACRFCVTISEFNRRYIARRFPAIDPQKIIVARLGVEVPGRSVLSGKTDRDPRRKFSLLSVGRLHAVKNHEFLIRACARLREDGLDFECVIAGDGPERRRLKSLIRRKGLQEFVMLIGHVPRQQMDSLYERADVVVLTSRSEGLPLVLVEAMARGRIVLAPAITGIPELVTSGKTGFLCEPGSLEELAAAIRFIHSMWCEEERTFPSGLDWIRHAAHVQVLRNFNRQQNLDNFASQFLELTAGHRSFPHADSVLQQVQLPIQRHRGVPV